MSENEDTGKELLRQEPLTRMPRLWLLKEKKVEKGLYTSGTQIRDIYTHMVGSFLYF